MEEKVSSFKNVSADDMKQRLREVVSRKQVAAKSSSDSLSAMLMSPLSAGASGSVDLKTALQNLLK